MSNRFWIKRIGTRRRRCHSLGLWTQQTTLHSAQGFGPCIPEPLIWRLCRIDARIAKDGLRPSALRFSTPTGHNFSFLVVIKRPADNLAGELTSHKCHMCNVRNPELVQRLCTNAPFHILARICVGYFRPNRDRSFFPFRPVNPPGQLVPGQEPGLAADLTIHFLQPLHTEKVPAAPLHPVSEDLVTDCSVERLTRFRCPIAASRAESTNRVA